MRTPIRQTQKLVDKFSSQIRENLNCDLEQIVVRKAKLSENTLLSTKRGIISADPATEFDVQSYTLENAVLHELGHRVQELINPNMYMQMILKMAGYKSGGRVSLWYVLSALFYNSFKSHDFQLNKVSAFIELAHGIEEGTADFFALEIFPKFCSLSAKSKTNLSELKIRKFLTDYNSLSSFTAKGYIFLKAIYTKNGYDGVLNFIKNAQYYPPITEELLSSANEYLKKQSLIIEL